MSGGANDHCFFMFGTQRSERKGCRVRTEIDEYVGFLQHAAHIIALIDLSDDLQRWILRGASEQGLAHAAFGTGDDEFGHGGKVLHIAYCVRLASKPWGQTSNKHPGSISIC